MYGEREGEGRQAWREITTHRHTQKDVTEIIKSS